MHAPLELADSVADLFARIRSRAPRVHCITNSVAQQYTANMLLAAGAVPSMTLAPDEIGGFVAGADALLVNLGTFDAERKSAIGAALSAAAEHGVPWLLDPVFVERSPGRAQFARDLVGRGPAVVRLNGAEFAALTGGEPTADAPARFARTHGTIVALTGATDVVADGERRTEIGNGHALMSRVTAMGCAGSALVCAALVVEADAYAATVAALAGFGVAGEIAAQSANGPGSFAFAIIDALHNLDRADLAARLKVS
ncbi:MAG: hydroxyethylthiazole kinase [Xanthobacteraceae bacterium]|jgi:hydroxyethylthiazole kinase